MSNRLEGQTVFFSGAGGLLGSTCCQALAREGARLVLLDTNASALAALRAQLPGAQIFCESEWTEFDRASMEGVLERAEAALGPIDSAVFAAYPRSADWHLKWEDIPFESWRSNVDRQMNGYILWSQLLSGRMSRRGRGNLLFFGSIYGIVGPDFSVYEGLGSMTMPAAYAAIKGGLAQMTRYLSAYLGPKGVRVNCISPGGVKDAQPVPFIEKYEARVPLRRMATTDDLVGPVVFMLSDESRYITGHNLVVDGGWTAI